MSDIIAELDSSGNLVTRYSRGSGIDETLAQLRSGTIAFYDQNVLGSVTAITELGVTINNSYDYGSFGNLVSPNSSIINPFQFTGRDFDSETGLRYYHDSEVGRFTSQDPIDFAGGVNLYAYTRTIR